MGGVIHLAAGEKGGGEAKEGAEQDLCSCLCACSSIRTQPIIEDVLYNIKKYSPGVLCNKYT